MAPRLGAAASCSGSAPRNDAKRWTPRPKRLVWAVVTSAGSLSRPARIFRSSLRIACALAAWVWIVFLMARYGWSYLVCFELATEESTVTYLRECRNLRGSRVVGLPLSEPWALPVALAVGPAIAGIALLLSDLIRARIGAYEARRREREARGK